VNNKQLWAKDAKVKVELLTVVGGGHVLPQPYWRAPRILAPTLREPNGPLDIGSGKGKINLVTTATTQTLTYDAAWFENPLENGGNPRIDAWVKHVILPGIRSQSSSPARLFLEGQSSHPSHWRLSPHECERLFSHRAR
jgi:hypothetical protein